MCTRNVFELREVVFYSTYGIRDVLFGRDMIESRNDCFIIKTSLEKK